MRYEFETTLERTDTDITTASLGRQTVIPITGTVLWHPFKRPLVDWYVGAGYSYVQYGDLRNDFTGEKFKAHSDTGFVAQTGFDVLLGGSRYAGNPRGPRWAINLDVRYINTHSNAIRFSSQGIEISPVDISLGASARF